MTDADLKCVSINSRKADPQAEHNLKVEALRIAAQLPANKAGGPRQS